MLQFFIPVASMLQEMPRFTETKKPKKILGWSWRSDSSAYLRLILILPLNVDNCTVASPWFRVPKSDCFGTELRPEGAWFLDLMGRLVVMPPFTV